MLRKVLRVQDENCRPSLLSGVGGFQRLSTAPKQSSRTDQSEPDVLNRTSGTPSRSPKSFDDASTTPATSHASLFVANSSPTALLPPLDLCLLPYSPSQWLPPAFSGRLLPAFCQLRGPPQHSVQRSEALQLSRPRLRRGEGMHLVRLRR